MRRALGTAIGLAVVGLLGCGGKRNPCAGSACMQIAGDYQAVLTPSMTTTCKNIHYGASDNMGGISTPFTLTQSGSDITFEFTRGLPIKTTGTLYEDGTVSFTQKLPHVTIESSDGEKSWDYTDENSITLSFFKNGDATNASGTISDTMTANVAVGGPGDPDQSCRLSGSLSAMK